MLRLDRNSRSVILELRRGVLNRGTPKEGKIYFEGISQQRFSQKACVHRDAERVLDRLNAAFRELDTGDTATCHRRQNNEFAFEITLNFTPMSRFWRSVTAHLRDAADPRGRYYLPKSLPTDDAETRKAYLQGYMDLRTRITATDSLPGPTPIMRVAVSIGQDAPPAFPTKLRDLMAREFHCRPDEINLLHGKDRGRESLIRIDARIIPPSFVQSHWQRIVIEDFRRFNQSHASS